MSPSPDLLRRIPSVDSLLRTREAEGLATEHGRDRVAGALRDLLEALRGKTGLSPEDVEPGAVLAACREALEADARPGLRPVINATGVILHTNLGRAPLSEAAADAAREAGRRYINLEFDLLAGERGKRGGRVEELLRALTGAEAALAVNNCAAAVLLALNTLSEGKETVISRGELIEIGGSFRIPEVLRKSGSLLREVGTTNRTHLRDYRDALGRATGCILKVHPSNYRIEGFTTEVTLEELVGVARDAGIPVVYDVGGGALFDTRSAGLPTEPDVRSAVGTGADIVCFSGDKLLGGPQAGYMVGRRDAIEACRVNHLRRALRLDKMTLAAAEATLLQHRSGKAWEEVPAMRMLGGGEGEFEARAGRIAAELHTRRPDLAVTLEPGIARSGGGSAPDASLPTLLISIASPAVSAAGLATHLRQGDPPVIARVQEGRLLLDLRTVLPGEEGDLLTALMALPRSA